MSDEMKSKVLYSQEIANNNGGGQQHQIVAVREEDYRIVAYQLENGQVIDSAEAVAMAQMGQIAGVTVGVSKDGDQYIRGVADGDPSNNLNNLQRF